MQKYKLVQDLASQLQINLIYLPAYSPNLNVIERLWRHVKHEVLYSRYYDTFPKFKFGVTQGCVDSSYCPGNEVTREQMAAFLARAFLDMD